MAKLVVISIGGWIGWWLGSYVGIVPAVLLSAVGSGVSLYIYTKNKQS